MKTASLFALALFLGFYRVLAQPYGLLVTDTGTNESGLYGINGLGYACGFRFTNGVSIPWIVTPELGTIDMPALPGAFNNGIAFGIDNDFDVAGNYGTSFGSSNFHINNGIGCVWHWDGVSKFVPYEFGNRPAGIRSINNGYIGGQESDSYAFLENLYGPDTYSDNQGGSWCLAVNAFGDGAGSLRYGSYPIPSLLFHESYGFIVQTPPAVYNSSWYPYAYATALNQDDEIVGITAYGSFYWNFINDEVDFVQGQFFGNNDKGLIVGQLNGHATMWTKSGTNFTAVDLNSFIHDTNIVLEIAFGINVQGRIVGKCFDKAQNAHHGFMLVPAKSAQGVKMSPTADPTLMKLSWWSERGHDYMFDASADLVHWDTYTGVYQETTNQTGYVTFSRTNSPTLFVKVLDVTPQNF